MYTSVQMFRLSKRGRFFKTDRERKKVKRKMLKDMASSGDKSAQQKFKKSKVNCINGTYIIRKSGSLKNMTAGNAERNH